MPSDAKAMDTPKSGNEKTILPIRKKPSSERSSVDQGAGNPTQHQQQDESFLEELRQMKRELLSEMTKQQQQQQQEMPAGKTGSGGCLIM